MKAFGYIRNFPLGDRRGDDDLSIDVAFSADAEIGYAAPLYDENQFIVFQPTAIIRIWSFNYVTLNIGIFKFSLFLELKGLDFLPVSYKMGLDVYSYS